MRQTIGVLVHECLHAYAEVAEQRTRDLEMNTVGSNKNSAYEYTASTQGLEVREGAVDRSSEASPSRHNAAGRSLSPH